LNRKWTITFIFTLLGFVILIFFFLDPFGSMKSPVEHKSSERKMRFSYALTVKNIPPNSNHVQIWLPLPPSNHHQTVENLDIRSDYPYAVISDPEYNNSILKVETNGNVPQSLPVTVEFLVTRRSYRVLDKSDLPVDGTEERLITRFLSPDRLVPTDGQIAQEANTVVKNDMTDLQKAKALYDLVFSTMTYDKSGTGWGHGDAIYACDVRTGNCTDFHSFFIGMARSSGIPTRFIMGFPVPEGVTQGNIPGYHCWAEFYIPEFGWVPIDVSEANKNREKYEAFFGGLDENRVQFTIGRDIQIEQNGHLEPLNYFIYPHVVVDGEIYSDVDRQFSFSEVAM